MKFHLDENVNHAVADGLKRHDVDVTTSTEVALVGAEDEEQLAYCLLSERVILTQDRDMLILASQGVPHAGIVYWQLGRRSIGQVVRHLLLLRSRVTADEMQNVVEYL